MTNFKFHHACRQAGISNKQEESGFTLIEVLVTVVIMGFLGIVIVQAFVTTIGTNSKAEIIKDIKQNGDFAIDVISRKIRNARSMDCSTGPNQILVTNQDSSTSRFQSLTNAGTCRLAQTDTDPISGSATVSYLTTSNLTLIGSTCPNAAFDVVTCDQIASQDAKVTFSFSLKNLSAQTKYYEQANQKFITTVSLRNVQY
jgi:prepilin-type N-terminal cleavage/methylation domain-containing protein